MKNYEAVRLNHYKRQAGTLKPRYMVASIDLGDTKRIKLLKNKAYTLNFMVTQKTDPNAIKADRDKDGLMNLFELLEKYQAEEEEERLKNEYENENLEVDKEPGEEEEEAESEKEENEREDEPEVDEEEEDDSYFREAKYDPFPDAQKDSYAGSGSRASKGTYSPSLCTCSTCSTLTICSGHSTWSSSETPIKSRIEPDNTPFPTYKHIYFKKEEKMNETLRKALYILEHDLPEIKITPELLNILKNELRNEHYQQLKYDDKTVEEIMEQPNIYIRVKMVLNLAWNKLRPLDANQYQSTLDPVKTPIFEAIINDPGKKYLRLGLMGKKESELFIPIAAAYGQPYRRDSATRYFVPIPLAKKKRQRQQRKFDELHKRRLETKSMDYIDFDQLSKHPSGLGFSDFCIKHRVSPLKPLVFWFRTHLWFFLFCFVFFPEMEKGEKMILK